MNLIRRAIARALTSAAAALLWLARKAAPRR